jgi:hypothetical protein
MAEKMGSSMAVLMNVSSTPQTIEVRAARAEIEIQMLEADLAHRQAFVRLKALMGSKQQTTAANVRRRRDSDLASSFLCHEPNQRRALTCDAPGQIASRIDRRAPAEAYGNSEHRRRTQITLR